MKRFKLLFLTTTLIFSSLLFAADGGGGGSKEVAAGAASSEGADDDTSAAAPTAPTLAVLHGWLCHPALGQARELLAKCILGAPRRVHQAAEENANQVTVSVEYVGSGIIIIRALEINPDDTVGSLREAILSRSTSLGSLGIRLFSGHGGAELSDNNVTLRDAGVKDGSTIVVVQITLELYLAQQRVIMAKLYDLLPDGFSKDGAIAILDQHPRNPGNWIGVEDASPEGFILKLDLTGNQLTGPIPTELGLLTKLRELYLHNNKLTGQIPTELGLLTQLKTLSLSENQLTGAIPLELGRLTELRELYLHNNKLTGPTPSEIIKNRIYVSR
jgi:hypothetical protein